MRDLTIVFDLDGTLVETAPDSIQATNHALSLCRLEPVAPGEIRPFISFGARAMIRKGLEFHGHRVLDDQFETLFSSFITYYAQNIATESHLFPGLADCLNRLAEQGARLAVCTNKQEMLSRKLLDALGIAEPLRPSRAATHFPSASRIPIIC